MEVKSNLSEYPYKHVKSLLHDLEREVEDKSIGFLLPAK